MTSPESVVTVQRRQPDGTTKEVECPKAVAIYNQYMNGVDKGDQLRKYYHVRLKCMKYYKYIFWFLFDVSITNAYILSSFVPTTLVSVSAHTLKKFRLSLATQLIGNYCSRKRAGRPRHSTATPHLPPPLPPADDGGPQLQQRPRLQLHFPSHTQSKRCVYCASYRTPSRRKESVWYCKDCPGQPTLCLTGKDDGSDCYGMWHSNLVV